MWNFNQLRTGSVVTPSANSKKLDIKKTWTNSIYTQLMGRSTNTPRPLLSLFDRPCSGLYRSGWVCYGCSGVDRHPRAPGARTPRLLPSLEELGLSPCARGAPFRGMPTGSATFLDPLGASGLWPCTRNHLKKGLVPHSSVWWDIRQISLDQPLLFSGLSGFRAGQSMLHGRFHGRKAAGFIWATFEWASCIIDTFVILGSCCPV